MALTYVFTVDGIAIKSNLLGMYKIIPVFFIEHSQNCVYGCAQDQPNDLCTYVLYVYINLHKRIPSSLHKYTYREYHISIRLVCIQVNVG